MDLAGGEHHHRRGALYCHYGNQGAQGVKRPSCHPRHFGEA
jgi:hypothetical protein